MSIARQVLAAFAAAALVALSGCTGSAGAEGGGATSTSDLSSTSGSTRLGRRAPEPSVNMSGESDAVYAVPACHVIWTATSSKSPAATVSP